MSSGYPPPALLSFQVAYTAIGNVAPYLRGRLFAPYKELKHYHKTVNSQVGLSDSTIRDATRRLLNFLEVLWRAPGLMRYVSLGNNIPMVQNASLKYRKFSTNFVTNDPTMALFLISMDLNEYALVNFPVPVDNPFKEVKNPRQCGGDFMRMAVTAVHRLYKMLNQRESTHPYSYFPDPEWIEAVKIPKLLALPSAAPALPAGVAAHVLSDALVMSKISEFISIRDLSAVSRNIYETHREAGKLRLAHEGLAMMLRNKKFRDSIFRRFSNPAKQLSIAAAVDPSEFEATVEILKKHRVAELNLIVMNLPFVAALGLDNLINCESLILKFPQTPIVDMACFAAVKNLTGLWVFDCKATDLSPLASLAKSLKHLSLDNANRLSTLADLGKLVNLESLSVIFSCVNDFKPLVGLTKLKKLEVACCDISDLSHLTGLSRLEELHVYATRVRDLRPLRSLKNLRILNLNGCPVSDLSPLSALSLSALCLYGSDVTDINAVSQIRDIRILIEFQASDDGDEPESDQDNLD